ncbi:L-lysine 2-3-aminomutase [Penicillium cf. viridicatum]|uniref:L-lysine 2-3-aminomutase n=1 Tax=Penicillium cf. viridicatum TaxID=2972119 RepID=A0A9W9MJF7_9EURO|nr:L-lysine 2-3-aminomutase [Penicillium cf. viridicatum]
MSVGTINQKAPSIYSQYTYDHRVWKTGLPVRSAVLKPHAGELVVGWVTTSESSLFMSTVAMFADNLYHADTA